MSGGHICCSDMCDGPCDKVPGNPGYVPPRSPGGASGGPSVDVAALNRKLCAEEGHVLGVVARPCLRCHEWFDPQYGRAPEPCAEPVKGSKAWHEIQGLRGYNARLRIEMDIIDRLLDGTADDDLTSIDMEYWIPVHDRIRALVRKSSPEPVAKPNPCRNECSLISLDDDHWKCNHCDAVFAYTGAQKPVEKPRCWWPLCKETAGDALCDAVQSALTKVDKP